MNNKFCPFVNGMCRDDCTFKTSNTVLQHGKTSDCLIAVKLSDINEYGHDDLVDIYRELESK